MFAGSIPENYDRYLAPLIFEHLAQRAATLSPSAVLETAAGSGVVTRALAPRLSPRATYVATDLNRPCSTYRDNLPTTGSNGAKRILWRCRAKTQPSISFVASSARCSFLTAHRVTAKQGES